MIDDVPIESVKLDENGDGVFNSKEDEFASKYIKVEKGEVSIEKKAQ